MSSFDVTVPGEGTLVVRVAGTVHIDADATSDDALTVSADIGLCDETASSTTCGDTYQGIFYQDPDDTVDLFIQFNATPGFSLTRVVNVDGPGTRTFYVNGASPDEGAFNDWAAQATVIYLPGANSLSGLTIASGGDAGDSLTQD